MRQLVTITAMCLSLSLSLSTNAQDGNVVTQIEIPDEAIGQVCEIVRKNSEAASSDSEAGKIAEKIARFDEKSVVLVEASRKGRIEKGVPILSRIPYVSRMFKNTAIVYVAVEGELTIKRSEIHSLKFVR